MKRSARLPLALSVLLLAGGEPASAQTNVYWRSSPATSAWGTSTNWAGSSGGTSGGSVPNSATVTAVFGASTKTSLTLANNTNYTIAGLSFASGAPAYTFTLASNRALTLNNGIVNNSANAPAFAVSGGTLSFAGGSAANAAITATQGGTVNFSGATAASSSISLAGEDTTLTFSSGSSAGSSAITADEDVIITLNNTSTLASSALTLNGTSLRLNDTASAGSATLTITNDAYVAMNGASTLGTAAISLAASDLYAQGTSSAGASVINTTASYLTFAENSTLGGATLNLASNASLALQDNATGGDAAINLVSSRVTFRGNATGGNAAFVLDARSVLDFEYATNPDLALGSLAGGGTVYLAGTTLTIGSDNTDTVFSGKIRPAQNLNAPTGAGITKVGTGNLTLSGDNSYTGDTTIKAGTLTLGSETATSDGNVVLDGGTLGFGAVTTATIGGLAGSGPLVLVNANHEAVTLSVGSNGRDTAYSGSIGGAGGLTKTGDGALTLSGTNTQSGATTITGGALRFANAGAISAASNIRFDGGVIDLTATSPSDFTTGTGGGQVQWLSSGGFGVSGGDRTVTLNGGAALVWGENYFMAGSGDLILGSAVSDSTITLANAIDLGSSARTIRVDRGTGSSLDAVLSGALTGSDGFIKTGAGSLALTHATYTGATRLDGGALRLDNSSHAPAGSNFVFNGGVLEIGAGAPTDFIIGTDAGQVSWTSFGGGGGFAAFGADRTVTLNGGADLLWNTFGGYYTPLILGGASSNATVTLANNFDLGASPPGSYRYVQVNDGSAAIDGRLSGVISGTSPLAKTGAGTLALTGANTYSGATWIYDGSLEFSSLANLGSSPSIVFSGGTLRFATGNTLDVSAYLQNNDAYGRIDTNGNDVTFATALSGYYVKSGAGTLKLTAASTTFTGLAVNGGTLELRGSGITGADDDYYSEVKVALDTGTTAALVAGGTGVTWSMPNLDIGAGVGSAGSMTVTDAASVRSFGNGTSIGTNGTGSLSVLNGASFATNYLTVGDGGAGTLLVDNGTMTVDTSLTIGSRANGLLTVRNGGSFTSVEAFLGDGGGGTVNVTGSGSLFTINGAIQIGYHHAGEFTVSNGATATTGSAQVGNYTPTDGTVTITGAGSVWNINSSDLALITYGNSSITLADGGAIRFTGASKDIVIGAGSVFNLGGGGVAADLDADIVNSGTFIINNTNTVTFSRFFSSNGDNPIFTKTGTGTAILAKGFTGNTINVNGGVLQIGDGTAVMNAGYNYNFTNGASLVLNTSYGSLSIGTVAGAGSLTFLGGGTLTLPGANTYTGLTSIGAGTVKVSNATALGTTDAGTVVNAGGSLNINGVSVGAEALSLTGTGAGGTGALIGTGTSAFGGAITLMSDTAISSGPVSANDTFTLSGILSESGGARALVKLGNGTLVLSAANTYTGLTTVSAGTLRVSHATALGGTAAGTTVSSVASLNLNAVDVGAEAVSLSGTGVSSGGALTGTGVSSLSGAITLLGNSSIGGTDNTLTLSGAIGESGGAFALTKVGNGTLILSGANTYTGTTTLSTGTLTLASDTAISTASLVLNGGTLTASGAGRTLVNTVTLTNSATIGGGEDLTFTGALTNSGGNRTLTASNTGLTTLGNIFLSETTTARTLTLSGSGDIAVNGVIANRNGSGTNASSLTKSGTGRLTLSGANTYTGTTTVSAGTLRATTNASALGTGAASLTVSGTGAVELSNDTGLNFARNTVVSATTANFTSDVLTDGGAGVTHTLGTLSIGAQTLVLNKGSNVTSGTAGLTFGNVSLTATGTTFTANLGTRLTLGAVAPSSGTRNFTVNGAGDTVITGAITTGTGTLGKSGAGTLTLSGTNTYTGSTSVTTGTLLVNGSLANTTVTVANGATLSGTGSIGGSTTIQSGATLAGSLTFTRGLALADGAQLSFSLGSVSDQLRVSGGALNTVAGGIVINLTDASGFVAGTYTLVDFTGATFNDPDASAFSLGTVIDGYTYALALDGSKLVLTATSTIPEPATLAALAALSALAFASTRRRRSK